MATIKVDPGICGLMTELTVTAEDGMNAVFGVKTDCPHIKKLVDAVPTVNGYEEVFAKYGDGRIAMAAKEYCSHGACPVPTGMLKGVEIVCSLALQKDVQIQIEK